MLEKYYTFLTFRSRQLEEAFKLSRPDAQLADFNYFLSIPQEELDLNQNLLPQNIGY